MTQPQDIRWLQRLAHFAKALGQLTKFARIGDPEVVAHIRQAGVVIYARAGG